MSRRVSSLPSTVDRPFGCPPDKPARRSKYNAHRTVVDGRTFDSKAEARRYTELQLLLRAGEITRFDMQPRLVFREQGEPMFTYVADFRYIDVKSGRQVIEDVKGVRTDVYKLKKKLIERQHGITITEVKA